MKKSLSWAAAALLLTATATFSGCDVPGLSSIPIPVVGSGGHLPDDEFAPGWKRTGKIKRYAGRKAKDYIGSQAELYRSYGLGVIYAADYTYGDQDVPTLTVESYEMEKPLAASGVYHYHRGRKLRGRGMPADIGVEAVYTDRVLYFYKDRYFFKLIYTGPEGTRMNLPALAERIANQIEGDNRPPRGFEHLAVEGVEPKSGRVTSGYTFNYDFLPPAIFAKAPGAGPIAEVFIIGHYQREEAEKTARDYRYFLQSNGLDYAFKRTNHRRLLWWGRDPTHGRVIVTRYGSWVIGVLTPQTYEKGEAVLDRIVGHMAGD